MEVYHGYLPKIKIQPLINTYVFCYYSENFAYQQYRKQITVLYDQ